ncbi:hypothetical protein KFK09_019271 [Dendrobium nobile]|uniref:BRO1 domain-containing protein n=1 Tax=Dendrobium nobile TaxID=94219 RepID=A0A8T3AX41_DENNO|nr:hypothetical protein KFK09_019271 [Dendrobium nobile]
MASPANVMLAIQEKKPCSTVDLYHPLRQYVANHYSEREAESLEDDFQFLQQMRSEVENPTDGSPERRRDHLQSYFRSLCCVEPRFPISSDPSHINSVSFAWFDAFRPSRKAVQTSLHLEKAAVLFNLGAVQSQVAVAADRALATGIKVACSSFQAAAGTFAFLKDNVSVKAVIGPGGSAVDMSTECAGMLERLMLAQAQECFFEKVITDSKPPGLCSKIARQVGLYYEEAHKALAAPPLSTHFERTWISHVQLKAAQYHAEACYRYALELHDKENIPEEIARLKVGLSALADAKKSFKGVVAALLDTVSKLESKMNVNLERAVKENDRVYLMRVPASNFLSTLPAASLVKSTPIGEVLDASKDRLFASLVPDCSAKALSRYTEMVDDVIRTQAEKLQQGSEITRIKLKEMGLPDYILALEGSLTLPLDLKEDVEAVQVSGGPSGLEDELQQLRDLRRVNQELIVQTEGLLQKEAADDAQFRFQFGSRWTRPQSSTLTKNLQDRLNKFAGNLKQAADADARIEHALRAHSALMTVLNHYPVESVLPSIARPIMSLDGNEDAIVGALKQSLRQLETVGAQRASLEDMLKEMKRKDDILPKLMARTGSLEELFRNEISKYGHICEEIGKNMKAQEQLLLQIQAQNDEFTSVFNLDDYKVNRDRSYKKIAAAVEKYREIKENINEGLKFYITLQDAITNVKQQCSDFVMTRNIQCKEMIDDVQGKVSGFNFSGDVKADRYPLVGNPSQKKSIPQTTQPQVPHTFQPGHPYSTLYPYPPEQGSFPKPQ